MVVIVVVGHDSVDEVAEVIGGGGEVFFGGGGGKLVDEVAEMVKPGGVEAREVEPAAHLGSTGGNY